MNISSNYTSFTPTNSTIRTTTQTEKSTDSSKDETVIQSRNNYESESDRRIKLLDDHYRKVNEQNKRFKYPYNHISDKYTNPSSPYYRHDMTEIERQAARKHEISWLKNGYATSYNLQDAIFRDEPLRHGGVEVAEQKAFNRQKVNEQFKQLLDKFQIKIPDNMKLTFTIDPNTHKLSVSGTDDTELTRLIEEALNSENNAKELFAHIIRSRSHDNTQFTSEKYDKYNLVRVIKNVTGYNLKDLAVVDGKFVTEDGTDIFDIYKSNLRKNPYVSAQDHGMLTAHYGEQLYALAKHGFDSIPDLVLSIGYEKGSLHDVGQKESYGTGRTDWLDEWKARVLQ
ncbi:DUF4885 family protein [Metabacillus sp. HB246100]